MRKQLSPSEPGADLLDDGIARLRAMKTTVGLVLARALEAAHSRFLVLGSTLATLAGKVEDLEKRDHISWPALDERLERIESRADEASAILTNWLLRERDRDDRITTLETVVATHAAFAREVPVHSQQLIHVLGEGDDSHAKRLDDIDVLWGNLRDRVTKIESQERGDLTSLGALNDRLVALAHVVGALQAKHSHEGVARMLRTAADLLEGT